MGTPMRSFWTRPKTIIWGISLILLTVIVMQNVEPTSFDMLFWSFPTMPKLVLILISMAVGALLTLALLFPIKRSKSTYTPE